MAVNHFKHRRGFSLIFSANTTRQWLKYKVNLDFIHQCLTLIYCQNKFSFRFISSNIMGCCKWRNYNTVVQTTFKPILFQRNSWVQGQKGKENLHSETPSLS